MQLQPTKNTQPQRKGGTASKEHAAIRKLGQKRPQEDPRSSKFSHDLNDSAMMEKHTATNGECAQHKKTPNPLHTCQRKRLSFSKTENEILLRQISLNHNANYLQMKSLNASPISQLGQMISLPNPSAEMGFQLKPSFAHRALLQIQFLK
jgi:hypothetical protein